MKKREGQIKITWEAYDGYHGGARPHEMWVDAEDWKDMNEDERDAFVREEALREIEINWEEVK